MPKKDPSEISKNKYYEFAERIRNCQAGGHYCYCLHDDKYYHYNGGYWEGLFDVEMIGMVEENIPEILKFDIHAKRNVLEHFKQLGRRKLDEFNKDELMNLENGMICPKTKKIFPHNPSFMSTQRLPYKYDQEEKCDLWIKSLNEILENDQLKIGLLQEFFGYCLTRETKHHKALLLLGESRSGKSTILEILRNIVGLKNCSSVPLKNIDNAEYTSRLINKLVNIDADVDRNAQNYEPEFKKITSGEPVQAKILYTNNFEFVPYCKMVMSANIFPRITDHSSAFYNRLLLIPCDRVFSPEEQNRDLPKQLLKELPGILNWAIEGLDRLTKRGRFEEYDFMRDAVEELENENNPVNLFFDEHIQVEMGSYIEKGELFENYKKWCETTRNFALSKARFASCVFRKYHKQSPKNTNDPITKKRIWKNLKYIYEKTQGDSVEWQD